MASIAGIAPANASITSLPPGAPPSDEWLSLPSGGTLNLADGMMAVFPDIPYNVSYAVYEVDANKQGEGGYSTAQYSNITSDRPMPHFSEVFVNTLGGSVTPPGPTVSVSGHKTWVYGDAAAADYPQSIYVNLYADGTPPVYIKGQTVTANNGWNYTFSGLPEKNADGSVIKYIIDENDVAGYNKVVDGYNLTNIHNDTMSVEGRKTWVNVPEGAASPTSITVHLFASNSPTEVAEKTVTAADGWQWSFGINLPKYGADGKLITYTVSEDPVPDYDASYDGYNITNTYHKGVNPTNPPGETTTVQGWKTWVNVPEGAASPTSITVYVLDGNNRVVAHKTVTAADGWQWKFDGLPKYDAGGGAIVYKIGEDKVSGYTATVSGYNLTNTYNGSGGTPPSPGYDGGENKGVDFPPHYIVLPTNPVPTTKPTITPSPSETTMPSVTPPLGTPTSLTPSPSPGPKDHGIMVPKKPAPGSPRTDDASNVPLWTLLTALSAAALAGLWIFPLRRRKKDK